MTVEGRGRMVCRREMRQRGSIDTLVVVKALNACLTYGSGDSSHDDVPNWHLPVQDVPRNVYLL